MLLFDHAEINLLYLQEFIDPNNNCLHSSFHSDE